MDYRVLAFAWVALSYIIYRQVSSFVLRRRHAAAAARAGCLPPPVLPSQGLWNILRIKHALEADRAKVFPDFVVTRMESMGNKTHEYNIIGNKGIMTCDPKNIQAILATQFNDFGIGSVRNGNMSTLLGNGVFTTDGKMWQHTRTMLRPQFAREQVSDLEMEERHVQHLFQALPADNSGWTFETDLQVLFFRLTLDSATEFLFGESVASQIQNLPGNLATQKPGKMSWTAEFGRAFDAGQITLARRSRFMRKYWLYDTLPFRRNIKVVNEFADYFVAKILKARNNEKNGIDSGSPKTDRKRYVFLEALAGQTQDPIELRTQAINILLAGRDTTASLMGWVFLVLARHPEHFSRLRQTVLEDFGTYARPNITFEKIKSCSYLQNILNETLRLYPVVPVNTRQALVDTTLPRGGGPDGTAPIFIPQGMSVDYSVYAMHRNASLWGEDATEFKPERWVGRKPGWEFLPFNGGPRICLGQQFAITEASYVIIRMLQRFDDIQDMDPSSPVTHNLSLTTCPGEGVKVKLHMAEV